MDPFSAIGLAGTIVQLAGLAGSALVKLYGYYLDVKDAPAQANDLRQELGIVISQLHALSEHSADWISWDPQMMVNELERFRGIISKLEDQTKVEPTRGLERLKWPFKKDETRNLLNDLDRCKMTFNLALNIEQM